MRDVSGIALIPRPRITEGNAAVVGVDGVGLDGFEGEAGLRSASAKTCVSAPCICCDAVFDTIVHIASAIFDCSAPNLDACPDESLPEFAFIGRSNVGKSSLLNLLAGERGLARVSPTPGFTKLINFFTINKTWRLVDLPGYGYAQVARKDRARFNRAVLQYLEHRTNLSLVFALIDTTTSPQEIDVELVEWLVRKQVPFVLVFTKADKVSAAAAQANIDAFRERIAPWFVQPPAHFTCSSELKQGRNALLGVIEETLQAIEAESKQVELKQNPTQKARAAAKKRPDLNRPWG